MADTDGGQLDRLRADTRLTRWVALATHTTAGGYLAGIGAVGLLVPLPGTVAAPSLVLVNLAVAGCAVTLALWWRHSRLYHLATVERLSRRDSSLLGLIRAGGNLAACLGWCVLGMLATLATGGLLSTNSLSGLALVPLIVVPLAALLAALMAMHSLPVLVVLCGRAGVVALHAHSLADARPPVPEPAPARRGRGRAVVLTFAMLAALAALDFLQPFFPEDQPSLLPYFNRLLVTGSLVALTAAAVAQLLWWYRAWAARRAHPGWYASRWHAVRRVGAAWLAALGWVVQYGLAAALLNIEHAWRAWWPVGNVPIPRATGVTGGWGNSLLWPSAGLCAAALGALMILTLAWVRAVVREFRAARPARTQLAQELTGLDERRRALRRSRRLAWAVHALLAVPLLALTVLARADPFPRVAVAALVTVFAVLLLGCAVTLAVWWWRGTRLYLAACDSATPRARTWLGFRRSGGHVAAAMGWNLLDGFVTAMILFPLTERSGSLPPWAAAVLLSVVYAVRLGGFWAALATMLSLVAWVRAGVVALHARTQPDDGREAPGEPATHAALRRARHVAVALFVAVLLTLLTATYAARLTELGVAPRYTNPAAIVLYLTALVPLFATQARWWLRAHAVAPLRWRLREAPWDAARSLGAGMLVACGWIVQFVAVSVVLNMLTAGESLGGSFPVWLPEPHAAGVPAPLGRVAARISLGLVSAGGMGMCVLTVLALYAAGRAVVTGAPFVAPRAAYAALANEPAQLRAARTATATARHGALGLLAGAYGVLWVTGFQALPFGGQQTYPALSPVIFVGSLLVWPLLVASHYRWARRAAGLRRVEREHTNRAQWRAAELRRMGLLLLTGYGWLLVFFVGPAVARFYLGTDQFFASDLFVRLLTAHAVLLVLFGPVALVALLWRDGIEVWLRTRLAPLGKLVDEKFPELRLKDNLRRATRVAAALLAIMLLPMYLEDWGLWQPPPGVKNALLILEGIALTVTALVGHPRSGDDRNSGAVKNPRGGPASSGEEVGQPATREGDPESEHR